ncbi:MAG TPA: hypothetical protein VGM83_20780 [Devosiaceae bacterium]|jgi:hypothetical protein
MYEFQTHIDTVPHDWVQAYLPWLALFAFLLLLLRYGEEDEATDDSETFFG